MPVRGAPCESRALWTPPGMGDMALQKCESVWRLEQRERKRERERKM